MWILANQQSWNAYAYVNGDPIDFTDPSAKDFGPSCSASGCLSRGSSPRVRPHSLAQFCRRGERSDRCVPFAWATNRGCYATIQSGCAESYLVDANDIRHTAV